MDEWNKVISVNMTSIMWGMRVFIDALVKDGRKGSIVNIASVSLSFRNFVSADAYSWQASLLWGVASPTRQQRLLAAI